METKRIEWIDSLKGFAIVCVVIGHVVDGYLNAGMYANNTLALRNIFNGIYMFHMALFFALSGMTFHMAYGRKLGEETAEKKYKKQIINICILYVLYCFYIASSKLVVSRYVNSPVQLKDILLIWAKPIYPYWYFYVLLVSYLLFGIKRIRDADARVMASMLLFLSLISGFVQTRGWFEIQHILHYVFFFYLGIMFAQHSMSMLFSKPIVILLAIVSICVAAIFWNNSTFIWVIPVVNTVVAVGIVLVFITMFSNMNIFNRKKDLFNYLGKHSLEVYLLHCFFTAGNRVIFAKVGITNLWVSITCNVVISTVIPLGFAVIVKRLGVYNFFFKPVDLIKSLEDKTRER